MQPPAKLSNIFANICDANFPYERILAGKYIKSPWIREDLKRSSQKMQIVHIKFLQTPENEFKHETYKSLFKKLKEKAKIIYYLKLLH